MAPYCVLESNSDTSGATVLDPRDNDKTATVGAGRTYYISKTSERSEQGYLTISKTSERSEQGYLTISKTSERSEQGYVIISKTSEHGEQGRIKIASAARIAAAG